MLGETREYLTTSEFVGQGRHRLRQHPERMCWVLGERVKTNTFLSWQNVIKSLHKVARGAGVKVGRVENHHTIAHVTIFYFYIIIISYRHAVGTFIIIFVDL